MSEFEGALQRILKALDEDNCTTEEGKRTTAEDWEIIFDELMGKSDGETISNIQKFILKNFSFKIAEGAEGFAYYGMTGSTTSTVDTPIFMMIDTLVKENPTKYGYISSTQAGKLFNEYWFLKC